MVDLGKTIVNGFGDEIKISDIATKFEETYQAAYPSGGKIRKINLTDYSHEDSRCFDITVDYSAISCDILENVKFNDKYLLKVDPSPTPTSSENCFRSLESLSKYNSAAGTTIISDDDKYVAKLSEHKDEKNSLLQIWKDQKLIEVIDTSEIEEHGAIIQKSTFASFSWHDGKFLYVCKPKEKKHLSYFKNLNKFVQSGHSKDPNAKSRGTEFKEEQSWGECLQDITHTIIGIYDVETRSIKTIDIEGYSVAHPGWLKDKIVFSGYPETPRKLGIIYCNNRPSDIFIYHSKTLNKLQEIHHDNLCFHTVRVSNDKTKFIFLSTPKFGVHFHAARIMLYDDSTGSWQCLTDDRGFFLRNLLPRPFSFDDTFIIFDSFDHLNSHVYQLDLKTKRVEKIVRNANVWDFDDNVMLCCKSSINCTPEVFVGQLVEERLYTRKIKRGEKMEDICYELIEHQVDEGIISGLFIGSSKQKNLPTVCMVHGGPTSNFLNIFYRKFALYVKLGLQTLLVNYRGSAGCSDTFSNLLSGNAGEMDVQDTIFMIKESAKRGLVDLNKLVIMGGSHGGFLACHLSCLPEQVRFKCAVVSNPVINIASANNNCDIPDWCFNVALGHTDYKYQVPTADEVVRMFETSPLSRVDKAYVPTIMILGSSDLRVRMDQGHRWVDALRLRGVEVECKIFPDKHNFDKINHVCDTEMSQIIFMLNHL